MGVQIGEVSHGQAVDIGQVTRFIVLHAQLKKFFTLDLMSGLNDQS
jgi:hypothetical protein